MTEDEITSAYYLTFDEVLNIKIALAGWKLLLEEDIAHIDKNGADSSTLKRFKETNDKLIEVFK